ncbi:MAG: ATP-binding protein, partial [Bacteroidota bacterium]
MTKKMIEPNAENPAQKRLDLKVTDAMMLELHWVSSLIRSRLISLLNIAEATVPEADLIAPDHSQHADAFGDFIFRNRLSIPERVVLMLALIPEIRPSVLRDFSNQASDAPEIGLYPGQLKHQYFPTMRTALMLLGGLEPSRFMQFNQIFQPEHPFVRQNVIRFLSTKGEVTFLDRPFAITAEYFYILSTGEKYRPRYSSAFPAKRITTALEWDELVLQYKVRKKVEEILSWVRYGNMVMNDWKMQKTMKPGYRALFYGPPGTGKSLTASLLGKATGKDVYRIDLSQLVSKYIGETEKNLASILDQAESKGWILFFDEADAIFGKRGKVSDSRDRYANQEVSYLLQRIEDFDG